MPSSEVRSFFDPDDYATSFREAQVDLTVTERGQFASVTPAAVFRRPTAYCLLSLSDWKCHVLVAYSARTTPALERHRNAVDQHYATQRRWEHLSPFIGACLLW